MMKPSLKCGLALTLLVVCGSGSQAAQITILARDLNNQPIAGVDLRVRVFDATDRNNPIELAAQQQIFQNTNGTLVANVNGIVDVQLVIDDNGAGLLETAVLTGLFNTAQQIVIVMPKAKRPCAINCNASRCQPVMRYNYRPRFFGLRQRYCR